MKKMRVCGYLLARSRPVITPILTHKYWRRMAITLAKKITNSKVYPYLDPAVRFHVKNTVHENEVNEPARSVAQFPGSTKIEYTVNTFMLVSSRKSLTVTNSNHESIIKRKRELWTFLWVENSQHTLDRQTWGSEPSSKTGLNEFLRKNSPHCVYERERWLGCLRLILGWSRGLPARSPFRG